MKFSIIVPIYNVENYLINCLDSILNQTYDNFEAILVCDKSTDKSNKIADKYISKDKRFVKVYDENTGLAKAKNIGVSKSTGDYLIFLDGDDYLDVNLLQTLVNENVEKYDILRYQAREVLDDGKLVNYNETPFNDLNGVDSFNKILKYHFIENSWLYAYNSKFYKENNFRFVEGCIAEDYGLTPLIIASAKKVKSISFIGYNYVQRQNSLMNNNDYQKKIKKMDDMLKQATYLKLELNNIKDSSNVIDFLDNSLVYYSTTLKYKDYKKYNKILKKRGCFKHYKGTTLRSKVRCFLIKFNSYFFFRYVNRG